MPDFLALDDLRILIGNRKVLQFFNDDQSGSVDENSPEVQSILESAESLMYSYMRRGWPDRQSLIDYANADQGLKNATAWVACAFAGERRPEFLSDEGKGPFQNQYDRSVKMFDMLSKGGLRGVGEIAPGPGAGANTGGQRSPSPPAGTSRQFVFAPNRNAPRGYGSFVWPLLICSSAVAQSLVGLV